MQYKKEDLLKLPIPEKQALAEALWNSIDDELLPVTKEEIAFANERMKMHLDNLGEAMTWEELRKKIENNYGF